MKRVGRRLLILTCAVTVVVGSLVYWEYGTASSLVVENPLVVDAKVLDLGEVWETNRHPLKVPVKNRSGEVVHVANIVSSCSCVQIEPRTLDLQAGEVREIALDLDLTKTPAQGEAADIRHFEAEIFPVLESGRPAGAGWPIKAQLRSAFAVTPALVDFGADVMRGDKLPTATLDIRCLSEAVNFTAVAKDSTIIDVRVSRSPESPSMFSVQVSPSALLQGGSFRTSVVLSVEVLGQGKVVKEAPVIGRLLDEVYSVPEFLSFGAVPVGESVEDVILLRSRSGGKFELIGIDTDEGSGLAATPVPSPPGAPQFRVAQKCTEIGPRNARLRFIVHREGRSEPDTITLPVALHGTPKT